MPKKLWTHRPSWPNYVYARKKIHHFDFGLLCALDHSLLARSIKILLKCVISSTFCRVQKIHKGAFLSKIARVLLES